MFKRISGMLLSGFLFVGDNYAMDGKDRLHSAAKSGNGDSSEVMILDDQSRQATDENGNTSLHRAVLSGDLGALTQLLADSPQLTDTKNNSGQSPLSCAVVRGHAAIVNCLVERGAKISPIDIDLAFRRENFEIFSRLLDALVRKSAGVTALHYLTRNGLVLEVNYLLGVQKKISAGQQMEGPDRILQNVRVDVKARDALGRTPLHYAVHGNHLEFIKLLVDNGADINQPDCLGEQPIHYAVKAGSVAMVGELLANGARAHALDRQRRSPLHYAVRRENRVEAMAIIRALIARGASVLVSDADGNLPITMARYSEIISFLEQSVYRELDGVSAAATRSPRVVHPAPAPLPSKVESLSEKPRADLPRVQGISVLIDEKDSPMPVEPVAAAAAPRPEPMVLVAASGPMSAPTSISELAELVKDEPPYYSSKDLLKIDKNRMTVLHRRMIVGRVRAAQILEFIKAGGDLNARDLFGRTALHYAVLARRNLVPFLLEKGAEYTIRDNDGKFAFELPGGDAIFKWQKEREEMEIARSVTQDQAVPACQPVAPKPEGHVLDPRLYQETPATIRRLVARREADPSAVDETQKTALHHLVINGKANLTNIQALIKGGCPINARDIYGRTALHYAVQFGRESIRLLLTLGADRDIVDNQGNRAEEIDVITSNKRAKRYFSEVSRETAMAAAAAHEEQVGQSSDIDLGVEGLFSMQASKSPDESIFMQPRSGDKEAKDHGARRYDQESETKKSKKLGSEDELMAPQPPAPTAAQRLTRELSGISQQHAQGELFADLFALSLVADEARLGQQPRQEPVAQERATQASSQAQVSTSASSSTTAAPVLRLPLASEVLPPLKEEQKQ